MKKKYSKGTVITLAILAGIVILAIAAFNIFNYFYWPKGKVSLDEKTFNRNSAEGNLTVVNDKLYFNFWEQGSFAKNAMFEIGANGSAMKHWGGIHLKDNGLYKKLYSFKNNLLVTKYYDYDSFKGKFYRFNNNTNKVELFSTLKDSKKNKYLNYTVSGDKIYIYSIDKVYVSYDAVNVKTVFNNMKNLYDTDNDIYYDYTISGDSLLYISKDKKLKEYDLKKGKYVFNKKIKNSKTDSDTILYSDIFKCGSQIVLVNYLDNTEIFNASDNFKKIYKNDYATNCFSGYNNYLFIGYSLSSYNELKGCLETLDINTGKSKTITKGNIEDISVFGDKWVYYTDEKCRLYRITHDGKTKEKVFG